MQQQNRRNFLKNGTALTASVVAASILNIKPSAAMASVNNSHHPKKSIRTVSYGFYFTVLEYFF